MKGSAFINAASLRRKRNMDAVNVRKPIMDIIKVKGTSRTSAVAGAIAGVMREFKHAEVQAIGASAVNQAVKAMALAKSYLVQDGIDIVFCPEFVDVEIDEKVRTAIKFVIETR
jgi:stage V sporulation protein S